MGNYFKHWDIVEQPGLENMKNLFTILLLLVGFASTCIEAKKKPRPPRPQPTLAPSTVAPTTEEPGTEGSTAAPTSEEPETATSTEVPTTQGTTEPGNSTRTIREQVLA